MSPPRKPRPPCEICGEPGRPNCRTCSPAHAEALRARTRIKKCPRFPLEPLLDATHMTITAIDRKLGGTRNTSRATRIGLNVWQADEWAVACHLHPYDVWGDLWFETALESESA